MKIAIKESGVTFGLFAPEDIFKHEEVVEQLKLGEKISKAEFIVRDTPTQNAVIFIEAKTSIPKNSAQFFIDIRLKMIHSLTLWFAAICGRYQKLKEYLPVNLNHQKHLTLPIKIYLVIPDAPSEYLSQLTDRFRISLEIDRKLWNINYSDIAVLNASRAKKYGLIGRE